MGTVVNLSEWRQARADGDEGGLGGSAVAAMRGSQLSATTERTPPAHSDDECYRQGIRVLARSDKTQAEMKGILRGRGFTAAEIEHAVQRFVSDGICDDRAIAERVIEKATHHQSRGIRAIVNTLSTRGIEKETIEAVLGDHDVDESDAAAHVAAHYAAAHPGLTDDVMRRRLIGLMQRRGFESGAARRAIDTVLSSSGH